MFFARFVVLIPSLLFLTTCAPNRQYHGPFPSAASGNATAAPDDDTNIYNVQVNHPELPRPFKLGFIEIDDTGKFFNPQQLGNILADIRQQKRLVLFVFIHGWQNNAKIYGEINEFDPTPEGDAQRFKNYLALMANSDVIKRRDASVYGVFIGWRGEQVMKSPEPVTNQLVMTVPRAMTFFSRKAAATRVGDSPAAGVALTALREATKPSTPPSPEDPVRIFMGHSFGSKVLEQAVAQWFSRKIAEHVGAHGNQKDFEIERFADLVLFMNSAGESINAQRMHAALPQEADFHRKQPYFVSVCSDSDVATKIAFPIGATLSTLMAPFQTIAEDGISESLFYRRTTVFNEFLINGHVDLLNNLTWSPEQGVFERTADTPLKPLANIKDPNYVHEALRAINYNLDSDPFGADGLFRVHAVDGTVSKINFFDKPGTRNRTGFWVLGVNSNLMDGHSDVWGPNCISLYTKLFRLAFLNRVQPSVENTGIILRGTQNMQVHIPYNF